MTEEKSSFSNLMIIGIISSIIGGLIVYYMLKSQPSTLSSQSTQSAQSTQTLNIQSLETRLNNLESQLYNQPITQQTTTQPTNNILYKNNESWEIFRGKDGFISKLNVLRDVKTNN